MRESKAELVQLQSLLDSSHAGAGAHLRSIFDEEHRLSADALVDALDGVFEMHLATLAGDGAPLVAPIDGIFFAGKIWFGLPTESVRARLVSRDPRVSASYTRESLALIVHGRAQPETAGARSEEFNALVRELYVAQYGPGWVKWHERRQRDLGPGWSGWIEPRVMFAKS